MITDNYDARTEMSKRLDADTHKKLNKIIESLLLEISDRVDSIEAERYRYGYIAETIRVNALYHGATEEEVIAMQRGEIDFITWISDIIEKKVK